MEKMKRKGCFIVRKKGEKGETFFNSANVCVEFVFVFFSHWSFCFFLGGVRLKMMNGVSNENKGFYHACPFLFYLYYSQQKKEKITYGCCLIMLLQF